MASKRSGLSSFRDGKLLINFCSPRDFQFIPGVGRKICDQISRLRETDLNITPESFSRLKIRNIKEIMAEMIDFSPGTSNEDLILIHKILPTVFEDERGRG